MKLKMSCIEIDDRILIRWLKDALEPLLIQRLGLPPTPNFTGPNQQMLLRPFEDFQRPIERHQATERSESSHRKANYLHFLQNLPLI
jgi:hypothetical protein